MIDRFNRQRLLGTAALTIGGALASLSFATPAQAACTHSLSTIACGNLAKQGLNQPKRGQ